MYDSNNSPELEKDEHDKKKTNNNNIFLRHFAKSNNMKHVTETDILQ